jgi:dephospho-CoA kinase
VARILLDLGAAVIDADAIAGECLADPGISDSLEKEFGPRIAGRDGKIDREALADLVFGDESLRRKLHLIVHPEILRRMRADLDRLLAEPGTGIVVIDAPLLLESSLRDDCELLIMVKAPLADRAARVEKNRNWKPGELERREKTQTDVAAKEAAADIVIENAGGKDDLRRRVEMIFADLTGS